jgi:hypothetical protein
MKEPNKKEYCRVFFKKKERAKKKQILQNILQENERDE